jgi:hypothetical protein
MPTKAKRLEIRFDSHLGMALYCLGLTNDEIADACGVTHQRVSQVCALDDWPKLRAIALEQRAKKIGKTAVNEQQFIRGLECDYARRLFGVAEIILRNLNLAGATIQDLVRVLDLASRLGRLGSGLPLNQVEVTQTYDLGENLMAAIERAYGTEAKAITLPSESPPPPPSNEAPPKP